MNNLISESLPEYQVEEQYAPTLLSPALHQHLQYWSLYPHWYYVYQDRIDPLVIAALDSEPREAEHHLLTVLWHSYWISYFAAESNYAMLDEEYLPSETVAVLDELDASEMDYRLEVPVVDEEQTVLCQRYGAVYADFLTRLDGEPSQQVTYLKCRCKWLYHTTEAYKAYAAFLLVATPEEKAEAEPIWQLLRTLML